MSKIIEKGYLIEMETSECDSDNWSTESWTVSTMEEVEEIVAITRLCSGYPSFSNKNSDDKEVQEALVALGFENSDCISDLVGTWGNDDLLKSVEDLRCYYVPERIVINAIMV